MIEYLMVVLPLSKEDGGGYQASFPDLPGCMSDGDTPEEAVANAEDAFAAWMGVQRERGAPIPAPGASAQEHLRRLKERESALLEIITGLSAYSDHADGRIFELERALRGAIEAAEADPWLKLPPLLAAVQAKTFIEHH